jgi:probable F420-dependent oxidoreductase
VGVYRGYGMTVPFEGEPLETQRGAIEELERLGYTDAWSSEAMAYDAFTPLVLTSQWAPSLRLGTAIVPTYTRGPALIAQSAASLASVAPGRTVLGLGTSSNVIVERWNGIEFAEPYRKARDVLRFLREAFAGGKVDREYSTFSIRGFRLGIPLAQPPVVLLAALREQMLTLAGREADGAIINWLSADDVATVAPIVRAGGADKEVVARIFVCPSTDSGTVRYFGRRLIASYLTVPVYAAFHRWLGRGDALAEMWAKWEAGDRAGATDAIPDEVVDALIVHGDADACRAHIARYVANGVSTPVAAILPIGVSNADAVAALSPTHSQ